MPYTAKRLDQVCHSDVDTLKIPGAPSNVNNMRCTLRRMLSLDVDKKMLRVAPKLHLERERERQAVYAAQLEQKALTRAKQPLRDIAVIVVDADMRRDEIVRLQWPQILWDKSMIFVDWGKTKKATRYAPLSDRVRNMLLGRLRTATNQWVFPSPKKGRTSATSTTGSSSARWQAPRHPRRPRAL